MFGEACDQVILQFGIMNLALSSEKANWFRKEGVKIPSGDVVGAIRYENLTKSTTNLQLRIADILIKTMRANDQASMQMLSAVAVLKSQEPLLANKTDAQIKQRLEGMFVNATEVHGSVLQVQRNVEGAKNSVVITLS